MKNATPTSIADQVEAQIDRSQWRMFKFSDLTENINEKISPQSSDLTHYIGLEHLDSGSLKIRRFGDPKAIKGDKLKIYKGDLIFAKRNAYLKRVSIAEFDAIASAHSMVLRSKPETVLPEFLPFFMLSDTFWERAIAISVGSLSPTINWKALAKQEFLLPPKDQQAKLAELLWAADEASQKLNELENQTNKLRSSLLKKHFKEEVRQSVKLEEIALVNMGQSPPGSSYNSEGLGAPLINGPTEFTERYPQKVQWTTQPTKLCKNGDILICVRGNTTGRINIANDEYCIGRGVAAIRGRGDFLTDYVEYALRFNIGEILRVSAGTTFPNIPGTSLKAIPVPKHSLPEQTSIAQELKSADKAMSDINLRSERATSVVKSLINQIF